MYQCFDQLLMFQSDSDYGTRPARQRLSTSGPDDNLKTRKLADDTTTQQINLNAMHDAMQEEKKKEVIRWHTEHPFDQLSQEIIINIMCMLDASQDVSNLSMVCIATDVIQY